VASRRRWDGETAYRDATPIRPEDLDAKTRGTLLIRAETRARRLRAIFAQHPRADLYWIGAELGLGLPGAHPAVVTRWREHAQGLRRQVTDMLDQVRRIEALVLAHEPETVAWLRRRLAELAPGTEGA
jgi:hypothetical protein